jgi:hypothetical protein
VTGHDYIARVRLSTKAGDTLAAVGERCDRVAPSSLPWLLESRRIEYAPPAPRRQENA